MAILSYRRTNLLEVTNLQAAQVRFINNSFGNFYKKIVPVQVTWGNICR